MRSTNSNSGESLQSIHTCWGSSQAQLNLLVDVLHPFHIDQIFFGYPPVPTNYASHPTLCRQLQSQLHGAQRPCLSSQTHCHFLGMATSPGPTNDSLVQTPPCTNLNTLQRATAERVFMHCKENQRGLRPTQARQPNKSPQLPVWPLVRPCSEVLVHGCQAVKFLNSA